MDTEKDFSEILNSLMQDKRISDIVSSLRSEASPGENTEKSESSTDSAGGFSIPPELLASLPQMMQALSSMGIGASPSTKTEQSLPAPQPFKGKDRKALLSALKPYLSDKRCAVVDSLLQIEGLWGILGSVSRPK